MPSSSSAAVKKQRTHFRLPGPVLDFAKIVYKKYLKQVPTSKLSPTKMSRHLRDTFKTSSPTRILKKLFELIDVEEEASMSESSESSRPPKETAAKIDKDKRPSKPKSPAPAPAAAAAAPVETKKRTSSSSSSQSKPKKTGRSHKTITTTTSYRRRHTTADDDITLNAERSE